MDEVNPALIERYQLLLQRDPRSQIFATLAEAYRKMGLLTEAQRVCESGLRFHPNFASGRVALARVFIDQKDYASALRELDLATSLSPENVLAHSLHAECALKLRDPKKALASFKMVLLLNPLHDKAQKAIKKLESLTADEYEEDVFAMRPLGQNQREGGEETPEVEPQPPLPSTAFDQKILDRHLSLIDAFLVRNDLDRVEIALEEAERSLGPHPELQRRRIFLRQKSQPLSEPVISAPAAPPPSRKHLYRREKIEYLKTLLERVRTRERPASDAARSRIGKPSTQRV